MEKHMEKSMWSKRNAWLTFSHILYDVIRKIKENIRKIMVRPNGQEGRWGGGGGGKLPPT